MWRGRLALPLILAFLGCASPTFANEFQNDCAQLVQALVNAERPTRFAYEMLQFRAGKSESFLDKKSVPWAGHYFPFEKGGIANRWRRPRGQRNPKILIDEKFADADPRDRRDLVLASLREMKSEINTLSPAEKMDIYLGNYDFRITRQELELRGPRRDPKPQDWEGFCNGRCAAAMLTLEPRNTVRVLNPDGLEVIFEPNDIKALLTASYFYVEKYAQMGTPNFSEVEIGLRKRVNPAAFDVALRAFIGQAQRPLVVDVEPKVEIWNYLAVGYERQAGEISRLLDSTGEIPADAAFEVLVTTKVSYVGDIKDVARYNRKTKGLIRKGNEPYVFTREYPYKLYLDENEKIVGGVWLNPPHLPDFVWFPDGAGTDAIDGVNPYLPFEKIMELSDRSTTLGFWQRLFE